MFEYLDPLGKGSKSRFGVTGQSTIIPKSELIPFWICSTWYLQFNVSSIELARMSSVL